MWPRREDRRRLVSSSEKPRLYVESASRISWRGYVLLRRARGPGVKVRRHDPQRYSRIVSSFLARLPFGATLRLSHDGQRSGGLMAIGLRDCFLGRAGHPESIAWPVLAVTDLQGGWRDGQVTDLQGEGGRRAVTDLQDSGSKMDAGARDWPPRSRTSACGMKPLGRARQALPWGGVGSDYYFFFVIFIFGNFRLTAATTEACSGFPELLAKASRA